MDKYTALDVVTHQSRHELVAAVALRLAGAELHADDKGHGPVQFRPIGVGREIENRAVTLMGELWPLLRDVPVQELERLARMEREKLQSVLDLRAAMTAMRDYPDEVTRMVESRNVQAS